jgi:hypothetical protein
MYLRFHHINGMQLAAAVVENLALSVIVTVSTSDHRRTHEIAFLIWLLSFNIHCVLYMAAYAASSGASFVTSCLRLFSVDNKILSSDSILESEGSHHLTRRWRLWWAFQATLIATVLFFVLHKQTCADGLYSAASFCEWVLVGLNVAFHACALLEFEHIRISLVDTSPPVSLSESHVHKC